ncbi:hypothetical protein, partial [Klebsiella pneumoniae]|uniref:hypothetical protein n=1 Tax=Klebsiella pneumoniae TaxID=573 RepID=UPI000B657587
LMMSLWDALRMNMMISYQELVRTFPKPKEKIAFLINNIIPDTDIDGGVKKRSQHRTRPGQRNLR